MVKLMGTLKAQVYHSVIITPLHRAEFLTSENIQKCHAPELELRE